MKYKEFKHGIVYLGDAQEILDNLGKNIADVCVTSPPYNLNKRYTESKKLRDQTEKEEEENKSLSNRYSKNFKKWYGDFDKKIKRVKGNMSGYENVEEKDYRLNQIEMISKLIESCKSSVFYNHKIRMAWHSRTKPINKPPSKMQHPWDWVRYFPIWCEIIWDRRGIGTPVKNRYHSQYEHIYQIGRPTKFFQEQKENSFKDILITNEEDLCSDCGTNQYFKIGLFERFLQFCGIISPQRDFERQLKIWGINPSKNKGHVCTFPEKLVEHCILPTTEKGDIILDPYLGAGTTAIVALKHGRRFIGIEIDPEYFELSCKNIQKAEDEQKALEAAEDAPKPSLNTAPKKRTVKFTSQLELEIQNEQQA